MKRQRSTDPLRLAGIANYARWLTRQTPTVKPAPTVDTRLLPPAKPTEGRKGFAEDAEQGLRDLEARSVPIDARTEPPAVPTPGYYPNEKLSREVSAGGGLVMQSDGSRRPHYWGHRERLRTRFLTGGHKAMPEYELLELLLFNAIERIDVKPLAKRLLAAFGDLNGVIAATEPQILRIEGATSKVFYQLRLAEAFAHRMGQAKVLNRHVLSSWSDVVAYCRTTMAHLKTEQFRILFLDRKNTVIADEEQASGTVDHVPVYPREVARRALELSASALILIHNHPSGDPTPSEEDIEMTGRIMAACGALDIVVHDHMIIGKNTETSFRSSGLI